MKKLIITCALLTSISYVSSAQTTEVNMQPTATTAQANSQPRQLNEAELKATAQTADNNTKKLQGKLALTKEQYVAVYKAEYRFQTVCDKYKASGMAVPNGLMSNITSERNNNIKAALTGDQVGKYEAMSK